MDLLEVRFTGVDAWPLKTLIKLDLRIYTILNVRFTYSNGCGSKNGYQHGTLVSEHMDQNLCNPSWFILSHT